MISAAEIDASRETRTTTRSLSNAGMDGEREAAAGRVEPDRLVFIDKAKTWRPSIAAEASHPFASASLAQLPLNRFQPVAGERELMALTSLGEILPVVMSVSIRIETQRSGLTSSARFGLSAPRHRHFLPPLSCCACLSPLVA